MVYLDGNPASGGTPTGLTYDCGGTCMVQTAHLPFNAGHHLRWKADGIYSNLQKWNGSAWVDGGTISTWDRTGTFMETSITRALLGSPSSTLKVHMNMLIESKGTEWTYGAVSSTSFTDGEAPAAFSKYFEFELTNRAKAPNTYVAKP